MSFLTLENCALSSGEALSCRWLLENFNARTITSNQTEFLCDCLMRTTNMSDRTASAATGLGEVDTYLATIATLLPLDNPVVWPVTEQLMWSLRLALLHIITFSKSRINLRLNLHDSGCNVSAGISSMIDTIRRNQALGVLGPGCSSGGLLVGRTVPFVQLPMLSYGMEAADFSNRTVYPTGFRLSPSSVIYSQGLRSFMKALNWTRVIVLAENRVEFQDLVGQVQSESAKNGIQISLMRVLATDGSIETASLFKDIEATRTRIIMVLSFSETARLLLCTAVKKVG